MKWIAAAVALLIGFATISDHPVVGLVFILIGGGIIAASVKSRTRSQAVHIYRPTEAPSAKAEVEAERRRAKRRAKKLIAAAESQAHAEGRAAVKAARDFVASEPRWV